MNTYYVTAALMATGLVLSLASLFTQEAKFFHTSRAGHCPARAKGLAKSAFMLFAGAAAMDVLAAVSIGIKVGFQ